MEYLKIFERTEKWIEDNSLEGKSISVTSLNKIPYPEVTGYFIPTLLRWGHKEVAVEYAKWLCSIQKEDGSWYSSDDAAPYVFDTAQVLKGLLAIEPIMPSIKMAIVKGCDWIISNVEDSGRLTTPVIDAWGSGDVCSELIHLYCLSPLIEASQKYSNPFYSEQARKVLAYYKENCMDQIINFNILSHFYAYIMEALVDLDEISLANKCMLKIAHIQKKSGEISAYKNAKWVCSTGVFQFAVVWYKLGNIENGNKSFEYACKLQNESGGWFGSYPNNYFYKIMGKKYKPNYFPNEEISWAAKYFLDALYYKTKLEFENMSHIFSTHIDKNDGRYKFILKKANTKEVINICDVGCGKGRYLTNLIEDTDNKHFYAVDLSNDVMKDINSLVEKRQGSLLNVPFEDEKFDLVYTVEALEHAIGIKNSIKELLRITKKGGCIVIIDKDNDKLGKLKIDDWEQWFDKVEIKNMVKELGYEIEVDENIPYENQADGLFNAWTIRK